MSNKKQKLEAIPVREFLNFTPFELQKGLKTNHHVQFDDGRVMYMTSREIVINRYIFDLLIDLELLTLEPNIGKLPIRSAYKLSNFYNNGICVKNTINNCLSTILKDIIFTFVKPKDNRAILDTVYKKMYSIVCSIYNDYLYDHLEYAISINIKDFLQIQLDPELIASLQEVEKNKDKESIDKSYDVLDRIIRTKEEYRRNVIGIAYIAGTVNPNQIRQVLAARGYVTEINNAIFKYPVASSFTLGMSNMYELAIESRSAAKALYFSNIGIQSTEYFARELQLVTMFVKHLKDGDCGNRDYMNWYVRSQEEDGISDLPNLIGKHFFNDKGKEEIITKNHTHLEGTTIKIRDVQHCKNDDPRSICTGCFGELAYSMFKHTNLGHKCSTIMSKDISQKVLSTKHHIASATSAELQLNGDMKTFLTIKNKNGYGIKPELLNKKKMTLKILISQTEASGIKDLYPGMDTLKINPRSVSRIKSIIMLVKDAETGKENYFPLPIQDGNKIGNFTPKFLKYIADHGYSLDDQDRYVIDLSSWRSPVAIIKLPEIEYSFLDLSRRIKNEFKSMSIIEGEASLESPESLLQKVFDLVNNKISVNLALLEVIVYAFTIASIERKDYRLGRGSDDKQLMRIGGILRNRSLGTAYGWEDMMKFIMSPRSFDGTNAIDSPMDGLFAPNELLLGKAKHKYIGR